MNNNKYFIGKKASEERGTVSELYLLPNALLVEVVHENACIRLAVSRMTPDGLKKVESGFFKSSKLSDCLEEAAEWNEEHIQSRIQLNERILQSV